MTGQLVCHRTLVRDRERLKGRSVGVKLLHEYEHVHVDGAPRCPSQSDQAVPFFWLPIEDMAPVVTSAWIRSSSCDSFQSGS